MCVSSEAHILIIAPEPAGVADLLAALRSRFARISFALDGQQGLARCQSLQPDLVLSEYDLPSLRGDAFMRMLRANPQTAGIPVMFLSTMACADSHLQALRSGARDFISRKSNVQLVVERIRLHLGLREIDQNKQLLMQGADTQALQENGSQHPLVDAAQQYIRDNLSDTLTADSLADLFGTTERRINEEFKQACGLTVHDFVRATRMAHAMTLLSQTDLAVTSVAAEAGYINPANFATSFRQYCGFSPSHYRRHNRANN